MLNARPEDSIPVPYPPSSPPPFATLTGVFSDATRGESFVASLVITCGIVVMVHKGGLWVLSA